MALTDYKVTTTEIQTYGTQAELDKPLKTASEMKLMFDRLSTYIVSKYNNFIDSIANLLILTGSGNKSLADDGAYKLNRFLTGFIDDTDSNNENIVVSYNNTTRVISLSGSFSAYYKGEVVSSLVNGWQSSSHDNTTGTHYLYYNDTGFHFTTVQWDFDDLWIAYVQYNVTTGVYIGLREVHGTQEWQSHQNDHQSIGTYRVGGGTLSGYVLNSTTVANRRVDVSGTYVKDEDLVSLVPALTSKLYTQRYLTGTGDRTLSTDQTDIIAVSGSQPYYNEWNGSTWTQTLFPNNSYGAIFIVAIPVASDTVSQKYRYMFVQPQKISATLSDIQALTSLSLVHGESATILSEFVFINKIIIKYTSGDWSIYSVESLDGNRQNQISAINISPTADGVSYIPSGDLVATNVQSAIDEIEANKKTDLTDNSDTYYPSQKAVKSVTDNLKQPNKNPLFSGKQYRLFAHAGLDGLEPSNTIPAFERCGKEGFYGVETDIRITSDGYFVCFHDNTVDDMTDGTGTIEEKTLAEVQSLTVDGGVNIGSYTDVVVPTLAQFLQICTKYNMIPMLNLYTANVGISDLVAEVNKYGFERSVIYATNSPTEATSIEALCDSMVFGVTGSTADLSSFIDLSGYRTGLSVSYEAVDNYPDSIELWHLHNAIIGVWEVSTVSNINEYFDNGCDFVLTSSILPKDFYTLLYINDEVFKIYESDFMENGANAVPGMTGVAISSGATTIGAPFVNHPGVINIIDSTTANGGYRYMSNGTSIQINGGERCVFIFRASTSRTTAFCRMGFQDSTAINTLPVDGVWSEFVGDGTNATISAKASVDSTLSTHATTYTLSINVWYKLIIELNSDASIATFILYSETGTPLWRVEISTNIPNASGKYTGFGIIAGETTTNTGSAIVNIDYMNMSINRKLIR